MPLGVMAAAQSLEGGCTVQATSDIDQTTMIDATRENPFEVDPEGSISWNATSAQAIMDHTWVIKVEVGGFGITVARGGDPNSAGTLNSTGSRSIADLVEQARETGFPGAESITSLRGIYRVFGQITGTSSCSGDAYVRIDGNPLQEPLGLGAAAVAALGAVMMIGAGVKKHQA
jgi:hypothetical protein